MGPAFRPAATALRLLALALLATAVGAASALAQAPGLPRTYIPRIIDSAHPMGGGSFGWGLASADLTGDGELDLLVAQAAEGLGNGGRGRVIIYDGVTGAHVDTIEPPEENPDASTPPTLAFVYVETMPDLGSCPGGDGADADKLCDDATIGPGDAIPEVIVGSRALRVNPSDGSLPALASHPRIGRAYVIDGATRAVLKRIDMPAAERGTQTAPQFGRQTISPQALPPCAGARAENNDAGVGPCPDYHERVRIGDLDGGGEPDIVITARGYVEARTAAAPGSHCNTQTTAATCPSGKAWTYAGEDIVGTSPQDTLETPLLAIQNPHSQAPPGDQEFGGNVFRVGDVNGNNAPDFVIAARNLFYPLNAPDPAFERIGAAILFDGATGARLRTFQSPEPQPRSQFTGSFNGGRAVGDLGATNTPDMLLPSPLQNSEARPDEGRAWAFNGDVAAGGGAQGSWNFATLTDPTPEIGGNFGGGLTGVGDLVDGPSAPGNEVLIGGYHFDTFTEASNKSVADLHIMNVTLQKELQRIPHPEGKAGDGFGVGIVPMGDLNDDGFLDFAASAYLANVTFGAQGRAYIFTSDNSPLPAGPTAPPAEDPVTPTQLLAGRCTNETRGTDGPDTLMGTEAGDRIFGFAGDDVIHGFDSRDCIHGGRGADRIRGGGDNDKLIGAQGADVLHGGDGRDRLFGMAGRDRLIGGVSRDLLAGGPGNDRLSGGPEGDRLFGEGGDDRIGTGDGRNEVDAGPGNDIVRARNRARDDIVCGRGIDVVFADRIDRVDASCEQVRLPG